MPNTELSSDRGDKVMLSLMGALGLIHRYWRTSRGPYWKIANFDSIHVIVWLSSPIVISTCKNLSPFSISPLTCSPIRPWLFAMSNRYNWCLLHRVRQRTTISDNREALVCHCLEFRGESHSCSGPMMLCFDLVMQMTSLTVDTIKDWSMQTLLL